MEHIADILDITFQGLDQAKKASYLLLWKKFGEVLHALTHVDDSGDVAAQADNIQTLASAFGEMWSKCMPADSGGVYMHVLVRSDW